jgi:hypothetical protein
MCRKGDERMRTMRGPDAHSPVPTARAETILRDEIPVYAEDFAVVFFPVLNGVVVQVAIE